MMWLSFWQLLFIKNIFPLTVQVYKNAATYTDLQVQQNRMIKTTHDQSHH